MRKYGSRLISLKQYKFTDLFLFAVILAISDLLIFFASKFWFKDVDFIVSLFLPIVLMVMMRWGWESVFFAVGDAVLICALNKMAWQSYLIYGIGNCFVMFLLLMTRFMGKQRIRKKWYFTFLFVLAGWILINLGTACVGAICGFGFVYMLAGCIGFGINGLLSLAAGVAVVLLMRLPDGMFEDQKSYLRRLDDERKERNRLDEFGDQPIEIDEQTLSILKGNDNELYK